MTTNMCFSLDDDIAEWIKSTFKNRSEAVNKALNIFRAITESEEEDFEAVVGSYLINRSLLLERLQREHDRIEAKIKELEKHKMDIVKLERAREVQRRMEPIREELQQKHQRGEITRSELLRLLKEEEKKIKEEINAIMEP